MRLRGEGKGRNWRRGVKDFLNGRALLSLHGISVQAYEKVTTEIIGVLIAADMVLFNLNYISNCSRC